MIRLSDFTRPLGLATLLGASLGVAGCATEAPTMGTGMTIISVEAGYRERIMLPPGHVLTVKIEDVSRMDAPSVVMAETSESIDGRGPPYTVTLGFPTSQIDPRHTYAARATISDADGRLVFVTTERHAVLTQGNPASARITMSGVR